MKNDFYSFIKPTLKLNRSSFLADFIILFIIGLFFSRIIYIPAIAILCSLSFVVIITNRLRDTGLKIWIIIPFIFLLFLPPVYMNPLFKIPFSAFLFLAPTDFLKSILKKN